MLAFVCRHDESCNTRYVRRMCWRRDHGVRELFRMVLRQQIDINQVLVIMNISCLHERCDTYQVFMFMRLSCLWDNDMWFSGLTFWLGLPYDVTSIYHTSYYNIICTILWSTRRRCDISYCRHSSRESISHRFSNFVRQLHESTNMCAHIISTFESRIG